MPPDQSNLLEGVEVWTVPRYELDQISEIDHEDTVDVIAAFHLPAIIEQARQEEREKVREALEPIDGVTPSEPMVAACRAFNPNRALALALRGAFQAFLDSLHPDTPEGGSDA